MTGQPITFPASTAPSRNTTENGGRLINAYSEKAPTGSRSQVIIRRAPGLLPITLVGDDAEFRGALDVNGVLYLVAGAKGYTVARSGTTYTVTELAGTVAGEGPVIMARNMRSPTPQILAVTNSGISSFTDSTVSDFSDADLPSVNSVTFIDGYFIFTTADGRAFISVLNVTEVQELDFATAEASVDGLVRAVAFGRDLLLMGQSTVEFWSDAGNPTGFPFTRGPVIPIGLKTALAVAGFEPGFPAPLIWAGNDNTVYQLSGYTPTPISTPEIERMIEGETDLEASVYVVGGHSCWVLTSPSWTIVYDLKTGSWHERKSLNRENWRGRFGVNSLGGWLTFDRDSQTIFRIDDMTKREGSSPLVWEVRSSQMHRFPGRIAVNRASFDFVTGVGMDRGISPIETDPVVSIDWSDDGGVTFGNALLRRLGTQGEQTRIDIWRCGLTGRNGRQWRLRISDPIEVAMLGGAVDVEARAA